jgi:hypothetical protein
MSDQYPRLTPNQVEVWLANPVTQTYLNCLKFYQGDVKDSTDSGEGFDMGNNDQTCNLLYFREGLKEAFRISGEVEDLLGHYKLVEREEKDNDKDA